VLRSIIALSFLLPTAVVHTGIAAERSPVPMCTVADKRVGELSGLVVTDDGFIAIDDSNDDPSAIKIFYLTSSCKLSRTVSYPTVARDPEDLALAPDGTLWVADIGDNFNASVRRKTIALWKLARGAKRPVIHRLTYPDGPHDAEALLFNGDGTPVIVTKELAGSASVFVPSRPLVPSIADGVPRTKAGSVRLPESQTPNFLDAIGRNMVTGGAVSPDGRHAVLRTYADAWEYDVTGGDVVKALTGGVPRQTPLPNEPQGEAVAYTPDGSAYVTASDQPFGTPSTLLRYTPAARPSPSPSLTSLPADGAGLAAPMPAKALVAFVIGGLCLIALGVAGALIRRASR
jgi:hypothetical protein